MHCFAGCEQTAVIAALRARDLWPDRPQRRRTARTANAPLAGGEAATGLSVSALAEAKGLPLALLTGLGISTIQRDGQAAVRIPYHDPEGNQRTIRFRHALAGGGRFSYRSGDKAMPYGLERLSAARSAGWILIVEGESDCWTGWHYDLPVLGIPGKTTWRPEWADFCKDLTVYIWQEPNAEDFTRRIAKDLPDARVLVAPPGTKDLSDAHLQGLDVVAQLETWMAASLPAAQHVNNQTTDTRSAMEDAAATVLAHADPLELVRQAVAAQRYGGDRRPVLLTYLAASSRVLLVRSGQMPVHLLLLGAPSAGKSYTLGIVLHLLPEAAFHVIDAGSPRVFIYDQAELRHRVVIFSEADSLPSGEDNPAASALRNLLQDHRLHYLVTVRDPDTGDFTVREIDKPGPTVLITTATRRLAPQIDSRLFTLEVPDDQQQLQQALRAQATLELEGAVAPDAALIAFQSLLQVQAPWDVIVPFADQLAEAIGRSPAAARILRDFSRLLSLIKAATVLRHQHRTRDSQQRLVATRADYQVVFELVAEVYAGSSSGASRRVREAVAAVIALTGGVADAGVRVQAVAEQLGINKMAASRRVSTALKAGFLVNYEQRKGFPYALGVGEPLPPEEGLPEPDTLRSNTVTPDPGGYTSGCVCAAADGADTHPPTSPGKPRYSVTPPLSAAGGADPASVADLGPPSAANTHMAWQEVVE
jgi:hypothetical protein